MRKKYKTIMLINIFIAMCFCGCAQDNELTSIEPSENAKPPVISVNDVLPDTSIDEKQNYQEDIQEMEDTVERIFNRFDKPEWYKDSIRDICQQYPGLADDKYVELLKFRSSKEDGGIIVYPYDESRIIDSDKSKKSRLTLEDVKRVISEADNLPVNKQGQFILDEFDKIQLADEAGGSGITYRLYFLDGEESDKTKDELFVQLDFFEKGVFVRIVHSRFDSDKNKYINEDLYPTEAVNN